MIPYHAESLMSFYFCKYIFYKIYYDAGSSIQFIET